MGNFKPIANNVFTIYNPVYWFPKQRSWLVYMLDWKHWPLSHSYRWLLSIPPENIRKPLVSDVFRRYIKRPAPWNKEAATGCVQCKEVFLKILQNSQENTCARVSFLIKLQAWGLQLYWNRGSSTRVFLWILRSF